MKSGWYYISIVFLILIACHQAEPTAENNRNEGYTPVTIVHPAVGALTEYIELNATSSFLSSTPIKADIGGYISKVGMQEGDKVTKGQELFIIQSKEAAHLGNTINQLDSSLRFKGQVCIKSPGTGYITKISNNTGDFVQEGEILASLSNSSSMVFLLDLPYELTPYVSLNRSTELLLPDGMQIQGNLLHSLPSVDPSSQTQQYIIQIPPNLAIPENLLAKVRFIRQSKQGTITLPKEAILTNEVQDAFWIMKMTDSNTAVKIIIQKGIESGEKVEILSPTLQESDQVLLTGNYGLPDTARVIIEKR
jgi:multidrug efflux pump subunit AcrA (membrane-fusion protein)